MSRPMRGVVDHVDTFKRWFIATLATFYGALLLLFVALFLFVYGSAKAAGSIPVPAECAQLAAREGFPTDFLTKTQVARARLRMARLSDRDPLVKSCREAILAARAANPTGGPP